MTSKVSNMLSKLSLSSPIVIAWASSSTVGFFEGFSWGGGDEAGV